MGSKLYGCEGGSGFSIKCLMKDNPMFFNGVVSLASVLLFSQAIKISEAPLTRISRDMNLDSFYNCIWMVTMTMTTGKKFEAV